MRGPRFRSIWSDFQDEAIEISAHGYLQLLPVLYVITMGELEAREGAYLI